MKPVSQSRVGGEGTCLSACVASLLECEEQEIGDLLEGWDADRVNWMHHANDLLAPARNVALAYTMAVPTGYSIGIGPSRRHPEHQHAVVCLDGEIVHDPSPRDPDLETPVAYLVLVPVIRAGLREKEAA